ncbi:hypothetical protein I4U23_022720 [Adineta vaga]|nr:hypothetical protein I4U23_022720 [Adineta vaga]
MSLLYNSQFQSSNTTCLPFLTTTAPTIRTCQITCLYRQHCKAAKSTAARAITTTITVLGQQNIKSSLLFYIFIKTDT